MTPHQQCTCSPNALSRPSSSPLHILSFALTALSLSPLLLTPVCAVNVRFSYRLPERVLYYGDAFFRGVRQPVIPRAATSTDPTSSPENHPSTTTTSTTTPQVLSSQPDPLPHLETTPQGARPAVTSTFKVLRVTDAKPKVRISGISGAQSYFSGTGRYNNTQPFTTPPSTSMCVGNGYVVQVVSSAIKVCDTSGKLLAGVLALNQFLNLYPYSNGSVLGDSLGSANCVFDEDSNRFFLSVAWSANGTTSAALDIFGQTRILSSGKRYGAGTIVAVSKTSNPTKSWSVYFIPGTNDGFNSHNDLASPLSYAGATGEQVSPRVSADKNGVYITTVQYGRGGTGFGNNIYALSKSSLIRGVNFFEAVRFAIPASTSPGTLTPAVTAGDSEHDTRLGGIVYFVSLPVVSGIQSTVRVWWIYNTSSLVKDWQSPSLVLRLNPISLEEFWTDASGPVPQKTGPIPYGRSLNRTQQVAGIQVLPYVITSATYQSGKIAFAFNVQFLQKNRAAIAYGVVKTSISGSSATLTATVERFQQFGVSNQSLVYPAIGLRKDMEMLIGFTLVGPQHFPSSAYTYVDNKGVNDVVFRVFSGVAPLDTFDAYTPAARVNGAAFGYSSSVVITSNGEGFSSAEFVTGVRYKGVNWGTSLVRSGYF